MYCQAFNADTTDCKRRRIPNKRYCVIHAAKYVECITGPHSVKQENHYDLIRSSVEPHVSFKNVDYLLRTLLKRRYNLDIPECISKMIYNYIPNSLNALSASDYYKMNDPACSIYNRIYGNNIGIKSRYICHSKSYRYMGIYYDLLYTVGPNRHTILQIKVPDKETYLRYEQMMLYIERQSLYDIPTRPDLMERCRRRVFEVQDIKFIVELSIFMLLNSL